MNGKYSFDECSKPDKDLVMDRLETLDDQGLLEFHMIDKWTFDLWDIDLDDDTIIDLKELFHEKGVLEVTDIINEGEMEWGEDWD